MVETTVKKLGKVIIRLEDIDYIIVLITHCYLIFLIVKTRNNKDAPNTQIQHKTYFIQKFTEF